MPSALGRLTDYTSVDITVQRMGQGGFGLVCMGPDQMQNGRWSALKTPRPDLLAAAPRLRELFLREALTWVGLWPHANLLTAHAVTEINGQPFLVLEYGEYGNLRELLAFDQPFAVRYAWAQMVAAGLLALHTPDPEMLREQPLVHRDLKPENVLVMENGYAVITDFGLAKAVEEAAADDPSVLAALGTINQQVDARSPSAGRANAAQRTQAAEATRSRRYQTKRGAALGTLAYMPPEQWHDAAVVGPPADIYAFGLILSELLAGQHGLLDLEAGADERTWRAAHEHGTPRRLHGGPAQGADRLPREVEQLYVACLANREKDRPTAGEALRVLQRGAAALGEKPYTPPEVYPRTAEHRAMMLHNWSVTLYHFGRYDEAMMRNARALALAPQDASILVSRGNILDGMGRREEALKAYDQALAVLPGEGTLRRRTVLSNRASTLSSLGRYAEADADYAEALVLMPDAADSWGNRALNMLRWARSESKIGSMNKAREHMEQALAYAQQALRINTNDPRIPALTSAIQQEFEGLWRSE